jgi:cell wall-associated NlpC family hydrolase
MLKIRIAWMRLSIFLFCCCLLLSGCAEKWPGHFQPGSVPPLGQRVDLSDSVRVRDVLLAEYSEWKGTDYRLGGLARDGIDCSGLVYVIFRSGLGVELPRTTGGQMRAGRHVPANRLRSGDLLFFRTSSGSTHVGIYAGKNSFIHASCKKGVTMSSLENEYWRSRLVEARRIP